MAGEGTLSSSAWAAVLGQTLRATDLASPWEQMLQLSRTSIGYCFGAESLQMLGRHVCHAQPG